MSQETRRERAHLLGQGALALVLGAGLAACGGGGGGGNAPLGVAPAVTSMPATAPAPVSDSGPPPPEAEPAPAPAPAPAPGPNPAPAPAPRTLAPGAELAPRLSAPQPGSTAQTGNDTQGIYESFWGYTFITSTGRLISRDISDWFFGGVDVDGLNWVFRVPTFSVSSTGRIEFLNGAGTFVAKNSMSGAYNEINSTFPRKWTELTYSAFNALAVMQQDMAGKWSSDSANGIGALFDINAMGNFTGSTAGTKVGECSLTGTVMQTEPSTSRNMFDITFKASNAATSDGNTCKLDQVDDFDGLGAVVMSNVSNLREEGAYRALTFHVATVDGAILTIYLRKR